MEEKTIRDGKLVPSEEFIKAVLEAGYSSYREYEDECGEIDKALKEIKEEKDKLKEREERLQSQCPHNKLMKAGWKFLYGICPRCRGTIGTS